MSACFGGITDGMGNQPGGDSPLEWMDAANEAAFCPYCGVRVAQDFEYCSKCGKRLP